MNYFYTFFFKVIVTQIPGTTKFGTFHNCFCVLIFYRSRQNKRCPTMSWEAQTCARCRDPGINDRPTNETHIPNEVKAFKSCVLSSLDIFLSGSINF